VATISVVACNLGRGTTVDNVLVDNLRIQHSAKNFGEELYSHLHIYCEKFSVRTASVAVHPDSGRKYTRDAATNDWKDKEPGSKIVFSSSGSIADVYLKKYDEEIDEILFEAELDQIISLV
jgi:hypothetical protein